MIPSICVIVYRRPQPAPPPPHRRHSSRPPRQAQLIEPTFIIQPTQNVVVIQTTPVPDGHPSTPSNAEDCVNDLTFVGDLTIPDNTFITYGSTIDKQWLVQNSGTCNWNDKYRLRHIGGAELGAPEEILLLPRQVSAHKPRSKSLSPPPSPMANTKPPGRRSIRSAWPSVTRSTSRILVAAP